MKKVLARFRKAGSFIAGLLVGFSLMVPVFLMMDVDVGDGGTSWLFGAPIILALGIALQVIVTSKPKPRPLRRTEPALGALSVRIVALDHRR